MSKIHPSAIIGKRAELGKNNEIGPGCIIEDGATIGNNNKLWANVFVAAGTTLGDGNKIHMGAVLGHEPQDIKFSGEPTFCTIGSNNVIREYVTIHRGTEPGSSTIVGDENYFMANSHLGHNCTVGNKVALINLATVAGHCTIEDGAILSGMVVIHQFCRIGQLAMISGLSAVNKDVPPYMLCGGRPAVIQGLNVVGLRRSGMTPETRDDVKKAYKFLYRDGLSVAHAVAAIDKECRSKEAKAILAFVKASKRGISAGLGAPEDGEEGAEGDTLLPKKLNRTGQ